MTTPAHSPAPSHRLALDALRPRALARALAACSMLSLIGAGARAQVLPLPSGGTVVNGQARIVTNGNRMTVTNTNGAIIDWKSFSIGTGQSVRFDQPGATSQVLNRVVGNDPSQILGSLSSNGRVWLLNPNGVLFGANARVDVAGLVASTLSLSNRDWLGGQVNLTAAAGSNPAAEVVNQGEIRSPLGGRIALIGGSVRNEGLIEANGGQVLLAAGQTVSLIDTGAPNIAFRVSAPAGQVLNLGTLSAEGGSVDIQAAVVNQHGVVRADTVVTDAAGRPMLRSGSITLQASEALTLGEGSLTSASGAAGGRITLDAGAAGLTWVHGRLDASGSAQGGGDIRVLGRQVGLGDGAQLRASGAAGGGSILVGGGEQGRDTSVRNADAVYVASGASLAADATHDGDGGRIVLWGTQTARVYGSLSARGGSAGGHGGLIETSGGWLDARPARVDASAPRGVAGQWLLDPYNITITDDTATAGVTSGGGAFGASAPSSTIASADINRVLDGGTSVTVSTGAGGTEPGDITVHNATLGTRSASPVSLTLNAARHILLDTASIGGAGQPLSLVLNAGQGGGGVVSMVDSSFSSSTGSFTASGQGLGASAGGVHIFDSAINTASGNITITGKGGYSAATGISESGVLLTGATLGARSIRLTGSVADAASRGAGVYALNSNLTAQQLMQIEGDAGWIGVVTGGGTLLVKPTTVDATAAMVLRGSSATVTDVVLGQPGLTSLIKAENGASISITGSSASGFGLGVGNFGATLQTDGGDIRLAGGRVFGYTGLAIDTAGRVIVTADFFGVASGASMRSTATGNAIVVAGQSQPNTNAVEVASNGLVTPNGRWLLFLTQPSSAVLIKPDYKQYDTNFSSTATGRLPAGNGILYTLAPTLSLTSSTTGIQRAYDGTTTITGIAAGSVSASGLQAGEVLSLGSSLSGNFADRNVGNQIPILLNPTSLSIRDADGVPVFGYRLSSNLSGNITPVLLSITVANQNKTYGNTFSFTGTEFTSSGLVAGETIGQISLASSGAAATAGVAGSPYAIVGSNARGGSFNPGNYSIQYVNGQMTVSPALLSIVASSLGKVYGSSTTFSGSEFSSTGLANGESIGLVSLSSSGAAATAAVAGSPYDIVVSNARGGSFNPANYSIQYVNGKLNVSPALLSITASNQNKQYGNSFSFSGTEFSASGLVNGETIDRVSLGSSGAAATASVAGGPYEIVASNASGGSFKVGNYSIQYVSGRMTVTPAPLLVALVGNPTKVFDGSTSALLTPANFALSGLVNGDSTSVTQGSGRYDNAEPGARTVSVTLARGDFASGGSTDLRNYSLPTSVSGSGTISPRPVVDSGQATAQPLGTALQQVTLAKAATSATEGRALDVTPALSSTSQDGNVGFQTIAVSGMSQDALAALLASRELLKKNIFGTSLTRLAQDPKLADLADCVDLKQLEQGNCLITEGLKAQLSEARVKEQAAQAPGPTAQPGPAPSTQAAVAAPGAVAPPAATPARVAAAPTRLLPAKRKVVKSALPQIARKIALVIGIDRYADKAIPQLDNAGRDARSVGQLLESSLGYEVSVVANGSKEDIVQALNRLAGEVDANDSVVIYYAGHGAVVESTGLGYWQPANAVADKPETWISNSDINKLIGRIGASQVALISDSCFSGSLITGQRIRSSAELVDPGKLLSQKSVVIMTSGGNEPVFDSGKDGHSPFAWNLMRNLERVSTWQTGGNLFERVRFAVARELPQKPQYAAVTEAGHQAGGDYLFEQRELEQSVPR